MKFFVVFLALAMLVSIQGESVEETDKITDPNKECLEETGADEVLVNGAKLGYFDFVDTKTKKFFLCFFKKIKMMDDEGNADKAAVPVLHDEGDRKKFNEFVDICLVKKGDTMEDIAWNYMKCFISYMLDARKNVKNTNK